MIKVVRFSPTDEKRAGLKDDISFAFSELAPFEPNTTISKFPEGQRSFRSLTDVEAQVLADQDAIIYVNVDPDSPTSKTIFEPTVEVDPNTGEQRTVDGFSIIPATVQQITDEIQRVGDIRAQVRSSLSNFLALKFKIGDEEKQILTQGDKESIEDSEISLRRATKGEVLDTADEFNTLSGLSPAAFTNYIISASEGKFTAAVSVPETNILEVESAGLFVKGQFVTISFPRSLLDGALVPQFSDNPNDFPPRDVVFVKIQSVNVADSTIKLGPTQFSPLLSGSVFTQPEIDAINNKELAVVAPGIPVLFNQKSADFSLSLNEARTFIEGEIPVTILYTPRQAQPDGSATFIGNLKRTSVTVDIIEDGNRVPLVTQGEAQPGVSVDYRLVTTAGPAYGDVEVNVRLVAPNARLPLAGPVSNGSSVVRVGTRIASTPGRLKPLGAAVDQNKSPILQLPTVDFFAEAAAAIQNFSEENVEPGEFYFNQQIRTATGEVINLNRFGTIRIFDTVLFKRRIGDVDQTIATRKINGVDEANSLLILDTPLTVPLPADTVVEIPQSPFNPGRKYKIEVSAEDAEDSDPPPTTPQPPSVGTTSAIQSPDNLVPPGG